MSGLEKVDKLVDAGTKEYLIIVTPDKLQPKVNVLRDYLTDEFLACLLYADA